MAVKICTTGGSCITCNTVSVAGVKETIKKAGRDGFVCCDNDTKCVAVAHITTIETVSLGDEGQEGDEEQTGGRRSEEETEEMTTFP